MPGPQLLQCQKEQSKKTSLMNVGVSPSIVSPNKDSYCFFICQNAT